MFWKLQERVLDRLPRIAPGVIFSAMVAGISTIAIAPASADVKVVADQAKVFRLDEPAETIILGNPSIADVTVHDRLTIVITGKSYGSTNLVVLNDASEPVVEELITVTAEMAGYVAVQRNNSRVTYSCNPDCQEVLRLGDDKKKMEDVSSSISLRNELAENGIIANNND
ncbi:pilus assembly protein N-terminal domain-containing protein [Pseudovibrio japonicus]|uniref:pilus assembly protein N-terminal domain-containing protein n=1 Tax=Pseudovibrio japonicus TaxID=366534 RepID=UPI001AD8B0D9|nr:pilus assembly protein N-terminal domain-containing protein [Pseudovibrio japonicus]